MEEKEAKGKEKGNVGRRKRLRDWDSKVVSNGYCYFKCFPCVTWLISLVYFNILWTVVIYHIFIAMLFLSCTFIDRERYSDRESRDEREIDEAVSESSAG